MNKKYYYLDLLATNTESYKRAFRFAISLLNETQHHCRIVFVVVNKNSVEQLNSAFGKEAISKMKTGTNVNGISLRIESVNTYHGNNFNESEDIVICCGLNSTELFKIQDSYDINALIEIPWNLDHIFDWINTCHAKLLDAEGKVINNSFNEASDIAKLAMQSLNSRVNLSQLDHPLDINLIKTYILALHKNEELDSNLICAYLIVELRWSAKNANILRGLIDKLNVGKSFVGGDRKSLDTFYNKWKNEILNS